MRDSLVDHGNTVVEDESVELSEGDDELNRVSVRRLLGNHPESESDGKRSPENLVEEEAIREVEFQRGGSREGGRDERRVKEGKFGTDGGAGFHQNCRYKSICD